MLIALLTAGVCQPTTLAAQGRSIPRGSEAEADEAAGDEETWTPLPEGQRYRYPLLNGLAVSADVMSPVMEIFTNDYANYEGRVTIDLHHRFQPQLAVGVGHCNEEADGGYTYHVKATPYFKVGCGYVFKYNDWRPRDFYYAAMRYGFSSSKADITHLTYTDGYWQDPAPMDLRDIKYNCHWLELGGGIKVHVAGAVSLGWELWYKNLLAKGKNSSQYGTPHFVPGYGTTTGHLGFAFHAYFELYARRRNP